MTFTGWDRHTDLAELATFLEDCRQATVEVAVLHSASKSDEDRYPLARQAEEILRTAKAAGQRTALHLCGRAARELLDSATAEHDATKVAVSWAVADLIHLADRVQVNVHEDFWTSGPEKYLRAHDAACALRRPVIVQSRGLDAWPEMRHIAPHADRTVPFLFDRSGGRGESLMTADGPVCPMPVPGRLVGYAGGFNPDNVAEFMRYIHSEGVGERVWLDMESGIRETMPVGVRRSDDPPPPTYVSIGKCRQVMAAIEPWLARP